jgi:hypothetical protein
MNVLKAISNWNTLLPVADYKANDMNKTEKKNCSGLIKEIPNKSNLQYISCSHY